MSDDTIWDDARIREVFIYDGGESEYHDPANGAREHRRIAGEIFDRWLAARDATPVTVTDDMVERAQEAFYEFAFGPGQVSPRQKSVTRQAWRVALVAALTPTHKPSEGES